MNKKITSETESGSIAVGVLFSQSGSMAVTEKAHLEGTLLAIREINENGGVLGKIIAPIIENPGSSPHQYSLLAKDILSKNDRVSAVFGCCSSASRKAVLPVIERFGSMLFYPSFYEGFEYSPSIIYTGASPNQTVIPLIKYLFNNYGKKIFLVGSDYIYPQEMNRIVKEFLEESGGSLVGEEYIALGSNKAAYRRVVEKIRNSSCDAVLSTVVGEDTASFYDQYDDVLKGSDVAPIASLTTSEAELLLMKESSRVGHITSSSYFSSIDYPENDNFIQGFKKQYGEASQPSVYSQTAYFQVYLFAKALEISGVEYDIQALTDSLRDLKIDTPQGEAWVDGETNHVYLTPRIGVAKKDGSFDVVWENKTLVKPDPYLVGYNRTILSKLTSKKYFYE
ncbi:MAG: transporter substrate-binding domain-containing protein [Arenicella sp.]